MNARQKRRRERRVWETNSYRLRKGSAIAESLSLSLPTHLECLPAMSVPAMDSFKTVLKFLTNQKSTIGYSFMAILTIGSERIFSMVSFQCPCNRGQNFAYGLAFLLGPAVVLLTIGLFVSARLWRLYTGCCLNPIKLCPRGNITGCLSVFVKVLTGAFIAPVMWLTVALLNGTFYECAVSGLDENMVVKIFCQNKTLTCREELPRVPCGKSQLPTNENMELLLMLRAQSQVSTDYVTLLKIKVLY